MGLQNNDTSYCLSSEKIPFFERRNYYYLAWFKSNLQMYANINHNYKS